MFWLTVDTDANRQFDPSFRCSPEKRKKTVTCRVTSCCWIFIEIAYLFLVDSDWKNFFLFEFIWMIFIPFDDHKTMIFVKFDF